MSKKQYTLAKLQAQVDQFNSTYSIGSKVKIKNYMNEIKIYTVKSTATILGGHTAVGWFEEIASCYMLDKVVK